MNHTPTPWKVDKEMKRNGAPIITADRCWMGNFRQVAKVLYHNGSEDPEVDANARFVITACNAHEELVKIAKAYRNHLTACANTYGLVATYHHINDVLTTIEQGA